MQNFCKNVVGQSLGPQHGETTGAGVWEKNVAPGEGCIPFRGKKPGGGRRVGQGAKHTEKINKSRKERLQYRQRFWIGGKKSLRGGKKIAIERGIQGGGLITRSCIKT